MSGRKRDSKVSVVDDCSLHGEVLRLAESPVPLDLAWLGFNSLTKRSLRILVSATLLIVQIQSLLLPFASVKTFVWFPIGRDTFVCCAQEFLKSAN